jgi:hypothetical protein
MTFSLLMWRPVPRAPLLGKAPAEEDLGIL